MELFPKDVMLAIQEQIKMVRLTKSLCLSNEEIPPPLLLRESVSEAHYVEAEMLTPNMRKRIYENVHA